MKSAIILFIKKYKLYLSLILSWLVLYLSSLYFFWQNYKGKIITEVNILKDASPYQLLISVLYVTFFIILIALGIKHKNEFFLKLSFIQASLMVLIPIVCLFFLVFGLETELGAMIYAFIMFVTMLPFSGFGITLFSFPLFIVIPITGIIILITAKKTLKKLK